MPQTETSIGADLGLKSFVVLSSGEVVGNPHFFAKDEKKLAKAQRRHAKKKQGSKNRNKARKKVARIHALIADRRRDFLQRRGRKTWAGESSNRHAPAKQERLLVMGGLPSPEGGREDVKIRSLVDEVIE